MQQSYARCLDAFTCVYDCLASSFRSAVKVNDFDVLSERKMAMTKGVNT